MSTVKVKETKLYHFLIKGSKKCATKLPRNPPTCPGVHVCTPIAVCIFVNTLTELLVKPFPYQNHKYELPRTSHKSVHILHANTQTQTQIHITRTG